MESLLFRTGRIFLQAITCWGPFSLWNYISSKICRPKFSLLAFSFSPCLLFLSFFLAFSVLFPCLILLFPSCPHLLFLSSCPLPLFSSSSDSSPNFFSLLAFAFVLPFLFLLLLLYYTCGTVTVTRTPPICFLLSSSSSSSSSFFFFFFFFFFIILFYRFFFTVLR